MRSLAGDPEIPRPCRRWPDADRALLCRPGRAPAAGHWQIGYGYTGTSTAYTSMYGGNTTTRDWATENGVAHIYQYVGGAGSGYADLGGAVTVTGTWVDDGGSPNAPVPSYFRVEASAGWSISSTVNRRAIMTHLWG